MDELKMTVSPICRDAGGRKYAYVTFMDERRCFEGLIPDCKVKSSRGFTEAETAILEKYMRDNLAELKGMAASINPIRAIMKK